MGRIFIFNFLFMFTEQSYADFIDTTKDELLSPFTTKAKYGLAAGSLFLGLSFVNPFEDTFVDWFQDETLENKPLGKYSVYGDLAGQMIPNAIYIATFSSISYFYDDPIAKRRAVHMLKSTVYSGLVTTVLKHTVREPRPDSNNRDSFPSGHTASAFAFAAVIGSEHEWYWGLAAYTMAAAVGYSRINDNAHHLHDVIAGATLGISYGLSLHYLYNDEKSEVAHFSIQPYGSGALLVYRRSF